VPVPRAALSHSCNLAPSPSRFTMDEKNVKSELAPPARHTESGLMQSPTSEIEVAPPSYAGPKAKTEQLEDAQGWESENLIQDLDKQLEQANYKRGFFDLEFKNPKYFTWMLVAFASMGGLLSGLDQSLISGANLTLPKALGLTEQQNSLVNSGMPLGGKCIVSRSRPLRLASRANLIQRSLVHFSSRPATSTLDVAGPLSSRVSFTPSALLSKPAASTTA
jgi:hypothetical protein